MVVGCLEGESDMEWLVGSGMLEAESMSFYKGNGSACRPLVDEQEALNCNAIGILRY